MLASIRGKVVERSEFTAVVECNGFGVEVLLTRGPRSGANSERRYFFTPCCR